MAKSWLRKVAIFCLALWALIWLVFLSMRVLPFDIRSVPAIGIVMLVSFAVAFLAPIIATGLAGAALALQPRSRLDLLTLTWAIAALVGQVFLFLISRWL